MWLSLFLDNLLKTLQTKGISVHLIAFILNLTETFRLFIKNRTLLQCIQWSRFVFLLGNETNEHFERRTNIQIIHIN